MKAKLESSVVNRNGSDGWTIGEMKRCASNRERVQWHRDYPHLLVLEELRNCKVVGDGARMAGTFDGHKKLCWDVVIVINIEISVIINSITVICINLLLRAWHIVQQTCGEFEVMAFIS